MGKLFGTDGARGIAGVDLTCETAMQIGRAAAIVLTRHAHKKAKIVIGKDTRISSDMLEAALVSGMCSVGADVEILGVIPTPAVAFLVSKYNADAGVMISASHNPVEYNGIKLFNNEGFKLSDEIENEIETLISNTPCLNACEVPTENYNLKIGAEIGRVFHNSDASKDYVNHIVNSIDGDLSGMKIAVDCANGSAYDTAKELFDALKAETIIINSTPNGVNINHNCGSTYMDSLVALTKTEKCDLGVAFDGDADRCLAVDENGEIIDGDKMIAIFSHYMKNNGTLKDNTAVVTVMSNLGFFHFAKANDINAVSTQVGDRYVLEEMRKNRYKLGGEQSGHIIFSDYASTGDGQLSAVQLGKIVKDESKKTSELSAIMEQLPQVLLGITADSNQKASYANSDSVKAYIEDYQKRLGDSGRILVRPSGTEALIRVMVEGKDNDVINKAANDIVDMIKKEIC